MQLPASGALPVAAQDGADARRRSRARGGYGGLVVFACVLTYVVIAWGGVVRATGAGLACPDWPLCHGRVVPAADTLVLIEWGHRFVAAVLGLAIFLTTAGAWRWYRRDRTVLVPATLASVFVVTQIILGAITVTADLSPQVVSAHLGTSMLVFAALLVTAAGVTERRPRPAAPRLFALLALFGALLTYGLLLTGSYVVGSGAGAACRAWPHCDGLPGAGDLVHVHMFHRTAVLLVGLVVATIAYQAWRIRRRHRALWTVAAAALGIYLVQALIGAGNIWLGLVPPVQVAHLAAAAAMWGAMVLLATLAWRRTRIEDSSLMTERDAGHDTRAQSSVLSPQSSFRAYVALTKPRIIELLLVTTVPAMVLAERGLPSLWLIVATVVGGALAAGGANAINCYVDRDIDAVMHRTHGRPLPRHRIAPGRALAFALALEVAGIALLAVFATPLAAMLAGGATLFYVFVYTLWLKRTSAQNIVIGGAAGAVPPLVGWAAVTGEVGWPAVVMFAIVFFWTPAHFWALALKYRDDYARANVPMAPVVWGAARTHRHILLYTAITVVVTFLLVPTGAVGAVYGLGAALLGGAFLVYALRLRRQATTAAAMRLFAYSIVYLFLLFAVMVVDQALRHAGGAAL